MKIICHTLHETNLPSLLAQFLACGKGELKCRGGDRGQGAGEERHRSLSGRTPDLLGAPSHNHKKMRLPRSRQAGPEKKNWGLHLYVTVDKICT